MLWAFLAVRMRADAGVSVLLVSNTVSELRLVLLMGGGGKLRPDRVHQRPVSECYGEHAATWMKEEGVFRRLEASANLTFCSSTLSRKHQ